MSKFIIRASLTSLIVIGLFITAVIAIGQTQPTWEQIVYISGAQPNTSIYAMEIERGISVSLVNRTVSGDAQFSVPPPFAQPFPLLFTNNAEDGIFAVHMDTLQVKTLLQVDDHYVVGASPLWSWDGAKIAYLGVNPLNGMAALYVLDTLKNHVTKIAEPSERSFAWSPDNRLLAFIISLTDGTQSWLRVIDVGTGEQVQQVVVGARIAGQLSWSADGKYILYSSSLTDTYPDDFDVFSVEVETGRITNLSDSLLSDVYPVWSPDGNSIVFISNRSADYNVYVMNADGGDVRLMVKNFFYAMAPIWSLDGQHIIYTAQPDMYDFELYIVDANGDNLRRLTYNDTSESRPLLWIPKG